MGQKEMIIHCGFHKTASSSIQHTLGRNRKVIKELGYYYPELKIKGEQFYNLSIPVFGFFTEKPEDFPHYNFHHNVDYKHVNNLISDIFENDISAHDKVIISDEFISHLSQNALANMKQKFEEMGFTIRVIAFLREPYNLAVSTIQQRVTFKGTIDSVIDHILSGNKVSRRVEVLKTIFEEAIEFHCFERACQYSGGPVAYFLNLVGIRQEDVVIETINESRSMQTIRLISYINESCPLYIKKGELNFIRQKGDVYPLFNIKGDKFAVTSEELNIIKPMVIKERELLSELLGDDFFMPVSYGSTDDWTWSEQQFNQLKVIIPKLNKNLRLRIYDYFYNNYSRNNLISYEQLASIGRLVDKKSPIWLVRLNSFNFQRRAKMLVQRKASLLSMPLKVKTENDVREKKNKFKKVILHVGPDKTGSSSIQSAFHANRALLLENNIYYAQGRVHPVIGSYFCSAPEDYVYNTLHRPTKKRAEIQAEDSDFLHQISKYFYKTDAEVLVLSSEAFVYLDEKALKRLHRYLTLFCESFEVVIYVREPLSYATSAMSQRVRSGTRAWSGLHPPILPYKDFLGKFVRVFGKNQIHSRSFSKQSLLGGDVVTDFLSLFTLPPSVNKQVAENSVRENAAFSEEALLIGDRVISLLNGYVQKGPNFRTKIGHVLGKVQGRKIQLTVEQQSIVLKLAIPHAEYLAKEFGVILGLEEVKPYTPLPISLDEIDVAARQLIKELVPEFIVSNDVGPIIEDNGLSNIRHTGFVKTTTDSVSLKLKILLRRHPELRIKAKSLVTKVESCKRIVSKLNKWKT